MKKILLSLSILVFAVLLFPLSVFADSSTIAVGLSAQLTGSTVSENVVTLNNSVTLPSTLNLSMADGDSVILDLNGFTIDVASSAAVIAVNGGRLVIRDSAGGGRILGSTTVAKGADGVIDANYSQDGSAGSAAVSISNGVLIVASGAIQGGIGGDGGDGPEVPPRVILSTQQQRYLEPGNGGAGGPAIYASGSYVLISNVASVTGGGGGNGGERRGTYDFISFVVFYGGHGGTGGNGIDATADSVVISVAGNLPKYGRGGAKGQNASASAGSNGSPIYTDGSSKHMRLTTLLQLCPT